MTGAQPRVCGNGFRLQGFTVPTDCALSLQPRLCGSASTPTRTRARWGPRTWARQGFARCARRERGLDPPGVLPLVRQLLERRRGVCAAYRYVQGPPGFQLAANGSPVRACSRWLMQEPPKFSHDLGQRFEVRGVPRRRTFACSTSEARSRLRAISVGPGPDAWLPLRHREQQLCLRLSTKTPVSRAAAFGEPRRSLELRR